MLPFLISAVIATTGCDAGLPQRFETADSTALEELVADDAVLPQLDGNLANGRAAVVAAAAKDSLLRWNTVRSGVSADRTHGYTAGFAEGAAGTRKFLAYWTRERAGWRIRALRVVPAPPGERNAPAPCIAGVAKMAGDTAALVAAEQQFSDDAQRSTLGAAFARHGSEASLNLGRGPAMTIGAAAIGAQIDAGKPPKLSWGADSAMVAASGDLGFTRGTIRAGDGSGRTLAFFTVWHRAGPNQPWRYIAE